MIDDGDLVMFESPHNEHEMDPGPPLVRLTSGQKGPTLLQLDI